MLAGTPTAIMVGSGVSARLGLLFKGGEPLEGLHKCTTFVFDKTGTLTVGTPEVVGYMRAAAPCCKATTAGPALADDLVLRLLLSAELSSEHHLARALVRFASAKLAVEREAAAGREHEVGRAPAGAAETERPTLSLLAGKRSMTASANALPVLDFHPLPGQGVRCSMQTPDGAVRTVLVGNRDLITTTGGTIAARIESWARGEEIQARTVVLLSVDGAVVAALSIADALKPEARAVIARLRQQGRAVYMVSGDNALAAHAVAREVGIAAENVRAQVTPEGKVREVERLQEVRDARGRRTRVAMVGDGVNDAAALVRSDVGLGVGSGTAIAQSSADVVLMRSDLEDVLVAIDLSAVTVRRVLFNYAYALGYNVLLIPLAAGVLFPAIRWQLPPWLAGAAMAASSLSVVLSSLTLKLYKRPAHLLHSTAAVSASAGSESKCRPTPA